MKAVTPIPPPHVAEGAAENFRRLFVRGLIALLPTLITFWLLIWLWNFLWEYLGRYILNALSKLVWLLTKPVSPFVPNVYLESWLYSHDVPRVVVQSIGVVLAIVTIYLVGLIAGGFLGKTFYRLGENIVFRIPLVRAIYPAVKQVTDFLLSSKQETQFTGSRVVAVKNHSSGIWSLGLYTGAHIEGLGKAGEDLVTVFIPSTPTAFTGYVVVVPKQDIVELPLSVEEAMRLLISGGVVSPTAPGSPSLTPAANPVSDVTVVPAPHLSSVGATSSAR